MGSTDAATDVLLLYGIEGLFYLLLLAFAVHATVLGFHWFSYGEQKSVSLLALAVYLSGGAVLFLGIATSLFYLVP